MSNILKFDLSIRSEEGHEEQVKRAKEETDQRREGAGWSSGQQREPWYEKGGLIFAGKGETVFKSHKGC